MRNIRNTKKGKSYDEIVFLLGYLQTRLVGQTTVIVVCFLLQKNLSTLIIKLPVTLIELWKIYPVEILTLSVMHDQYPSPCLDFLR